jgi:hypothetical protein
MSFSATDADMTGDVKPFSSTSVEQSSVNPKAPAWPGGS